MSSPTAPSLNAACQPEHQGDLLRERAKILQIVRQYFVAQGFLEVETPILIPFADPSPHLASFFTRYHHPTRDETRRLALQTSPEFAMKRLVAAGYPRIFQICKFFRDREDSPQHNPEFTGLEWYEADATYTRLMERTEAMCLALWPDKKLHYQGQDFDLSTPWPRLTVHEAFATYASLHFDEQITYEALRAACHQKELTVAKDDAWDDLFFKLFLTFVEPHLGQQRPTFLLDYPVELAALARAKPGHPALAERVELYLGGLELANGYSELIDPQEQRRRWEADAAYRRTSGDPTPYPVDPLFLAALESGMPPCTGIAVGLDRLIMLRRDTTSIGDVLPFPFASYPT